MPTVPFSTEAFTYVHIGEVVKVSSFDHEAALINDVEKAGDQVLCWRGIDAYDYLLGLGKPAGANPTCFK